MAAVVNQADGTCAWCGEKLGAWAVHRRLTGMMDIRFPLVVSYCRPCWVRVFKRV